MICSILDQDLYKLSMQNAVLQLYPDAQVVYRFTNRNLNMKFNGAAYNEIKKAVREMKGLSLTEEERDFLKERCSYLSAGYLSFLREYRFNPDQVSIQLVDDNLEIEINGLWVDAILWEVPLMAIISESYFLHVDKHWRMIDQEGKLLRKSDVLMGMIDRFTDFGTRRRRNFKTQDLVVETFKRKNPNFFGTSNVYLAKKYNTKAVGTMAHEWIMGISALEGLRFANRIALQKWQEVYRGSLGYALTDTFGTDAFFKDFKAQLARVYDGVRHDSGCPFTFADRVIQHYQSLGIDPATKIIVFSDGLDPKKAVAISRHCNPLDPGCPRRILASFGIGTNFTNDFEKYDGLTDDDLGKSEPLNMVIKLYKVNGVPVVKLGDGRGKATGDEDALRVARWTFFNKPLDAK